MSVYLLSSISDVDQSGIDCTWPLAVFSTREKAQAYVDAHAPPYRGSWQIEEFKVDQEPTA
jgi:hypothetical protein